MLYGREVEMKAGAVAYRSLKLLVTTHGLRPYEQLQAQSLANRFGVSATPVREALLRLQGEGLIACNPRRGFYVKPIDTDEMGQLLELRRFMLTTVLRSCDHSTQLGVVGRRAMQRNRSIKEAKRGDNIVVSDDLQREAESADTLSEIHQIEAVDAMIAKRSGNQPLVDIVAGFSDKLRSLLVAEMVVASCRRELVDEHQRIISALEADRRSDVISVLDAQTRRRASYIEFLEQTAVFTARALTAFEPFEMSSRYDLRQSY